MDVFKDFITAIEDPEKRQRVTDILTFIHTTYPQLGMRIAWGCPHFTDHGTFIFALSLASAHIAFTPESKPLRVFEADIKKAGYTASKMILRLPWTKPVDYALLSKLIDYNIQDKKDLTSYWRKPEE